MQMIGRAGRPQFDAEGVAVVMMRKDRGALSGSTSCHRCLLMPLADLEARITQLLVTQATDPLDSHLADTMAEHLNVRACVRSACAPLTAGWCRRTSRCAQW